MVGGTPKHIADPTARKFFMREGAVFALRIQNSRRWGKRGARGVMICHDDVKSPLLRGSNEFIGFNPAIEGY